MSKMRSVFDDFIVAERRNSRFFLNYHGIQDDQFCSADYDCFKDVFSEDTLQIFLKNVDEAMLVHGAKYDRFLLLGDLMFGL